MDIEGFDPNWRSYDDATVGQMMLDHIDAIDKKAAEEAAAAGEVEVDTAEKDQVASDKPGKPTAEFLHDAVVSGKIPEDRQTIQDFGFDRCYSEDDKKALLSVYRHLLNTVRFPVGTLQIWVSTGGPKAVLRCLIAKFRSAAVKPAVEDDASSDKSGGSDEPDVDSLTNSFDWLMRNRYVWDPTYMNSEARAIYNASSAQSLRDRDVVSMARRGKKMFEDISVVTKAADARVERGEPKVASDDDSSTSFHMMYNPDGSPGVPMIFTPGINLADTFSGIVKDDGTGVRSATISLDGIWPPRRDPSTMWPPSQRAATDSASGGAASNASTGVGSTAETASGTGAASGAPVTGAASPRRRMMLPTTDDASENHHLFEQAG
ncbi:hypothetical protein Cob_v003380 [Colletotrichum orbiculare MAFF 240422]|uniref:Uncharacterized protein n=1 Tax=Colletotrichum orbiculare (strain 104-T / ATCC 96160 / CBS 514.97 / LARS 414 / MAFF 240422) TaxID=1213857 RepID=A0A484G1L6_COLOR|nr:hypothetical protein Cob_v003380 [Colletotrichum orbiculare MAFF 240422]